MCFFFCFFFWTCFSLRNRSDSTWTWTQTLPLIRLGGVGGLEQIPGERVQIRSGRDKTLRGRIQTWTSPNLMRIKTQFQNSWLQAGGEAVKESTLTGSGIRSQYVLDLGSAVHQTHPGWMSPFPVSSWKRTDCSYNSDFGKWKCVCVSVWFGRIWRRFSLSPTLHQHHGLHHHSHSHLIPFIIDQTS